MTEYIIAVDYDTLTGTITKTKHEEIVRCRDCKYLDYTPNFPLRGGERADLYSCLTGWCEGVEGDHPEVKPDGFCAWGERRSNNARAEQETHDVSDQPLRFMCDACGGVSLEIAPSYCPCCGRKVVER